MIPAQQVSAQELLGKPVYQSRAHVITASKPRSHGPGESAGLRTGVGWLLSSSVGQVEQRSQWRPPPPNPPAGEGEYALRFSEVGTRVAVIASEPITGSASDWVAVSPGTALIVSREKGGYVNILRAPIGASKR